MMKKQGKMKEKRKNLHGFGEKFLPLQPVFETNKKNMITISKKQDAHAGTGC